MDGRFVSYLRVSTAEQGRSGLGLEAQRAAVASYLNGGRWELLAEFVEVESGRKTTRPQLAAAIERARITGATLVIAKLDRLSRNAGFVLSMRDAGVRFVAADNPGANDLTIGVLAVVAQEEARAISDRTKAALAVAKARGVALGNPNAFGGAIYREAGRAAQGRAQAFADTLAPTLREMRGRGLGLQAMARELAAMGVRTPRGGAWTATAVRNALSRIR